MQHDQQSQLHLETSFAGHDEAVPQPGRFTSKLLVLSQAVFLSICLFAAIAAGVQREGYFGADDLYAPTLITDLFSWSGSLKDWRITPAPYIFPDLALYASAHLLLPSVELAQYVAGLVHLLLFVWLAYRLVANVLGGRALAAVCMGLLLVPLLVIRIAELADIPGLGPLFRLTNHGGAVLGTVAVLGLCSDVGHRGPGRGLLIAAIAVLTGVSDPLFAASCAMPLLAMGVAACIPPVWRLLVGSADQERPALRNHLLIAGLAGLAGSALTSRVHAMLNVLNDVVLSKTREHVWRGLWRDLSEGHPGQGAWLLVVVLLCVWTLLRRKDSRSGVLRIFALWQLGSFVATFAAIIWTKNYLDGGSLRYLTVPFGLAPVFVGARLGRWIDSPIDNTRSARLVAGGSALMCIALAGAAISCTPLIARGELKSAWRAKARCVAEVVAREDVDVVLTDYWRCKPLLLFSDRQVRALQMRSKLKRPYFWIASRGWYRGEHRFGVIATNELRPDAIIRAYGEPAQIDHCDDIELFSYRGRAREKLTANMNRMFRGFVADPHPP